MDADEATSAIGRGVQDVASVEIDRCPMSDGGEGFAARMRSALDADARPVRIEGWRGEAQDALITVARTEHGTRVFLDAASVIGLPLVPQERRDPLSVTSEPLGALIAAAMACEPQAESLTVGLGGTATCDLGLGALAALGGEPIDARGEAIRLVPPVDAAMARLDRFRIRPGSPASGLATGGPRVVLAVDTNSPLTGDAGAARRFAPQKGATPEAVERLERAISIAAQTLRANHRRRALDQHAAGVGAAGGIPAGFAAALHDARGPDHHRGGPLR